MFLTVVPPGSAQRAVGVRVQVLGHGEGELRAALRLAGVLQPHIRRRPGKWSSDACSVSDELPL
jgi:hypothetical protein